MSSESVDVPNSSLALGTSALAHTHVHSTQYVQKGVQAEEFELSDANARPVPGEQQKGSVVEVLDVSKTSKPFALRARVQFFSLCWTIFLAGWSDSSTGPLLPRIQSHYHVL
jgi:hypothetical protein